MLSSQSIFPTNEDILKKIAVANQLIDKTGEIVNQYGCEPLDNSIAYREIASFPNCSLVEDVYSRALLCFESAGDHLMAFSCTLQEPAKTLSPYTCLRSLLESSALALWLLDLNIDVKERVGRCFGFRYKEFTEQIKFISADKFNSNAQKEIYKIQQRINETEKESLALGYPQLSANGKVNGIATYLPETVRLVKSVLDLESEYRMLSGVAHSYIWATRNIGFKQIVGINAKGQKITGVEKHLNPKMVIYGVFLAVTTFAKVLWTIGKLYGWNMQEIEDFLDQVYNDIGVNNSLRFWLNK